MDDFRTTDSFRRKLSVASVRVPQGFCVRSSVGDLVTWGAGGDFGEDPATRAPVHFSTEVPPPPPFCCPYPYPYCTRRPETCGARATCGAARMPRAQRMRRHRGRRIAHGLSRPRPRSLKRAVWWTRQDYIEMGRLLCETLLDMYDPARLRLDAAVADLEQVCCVSRCDFYN